MKAAMRRGVTVGDRIAERAFCAARDELPARATSRLFAEVGLPVVLLAVDPR
jgi:hypothetical protein